MCEGVGYIPSPGRPNDVGLKSWARPAILVGGKGRGGKFLLCSSLSLLFLFPPCLCPLLAFSGRGQNDPQWLKFVKPQHNQYNRVLCKGSLKNVYHKQIRVHFLHACMKVQEDPRHQHSCLHLHVYSFRVKFLTKNQFFFFYCK